MTANTPADDHASRSAAESAVGGKDPRRDFSAMNLAIFGHGEPGGVLWQPRLEYWYAVNKQRGTLPQHLRQASLLDVYDYCTASVRYFTKPLLQSCRNTQVHERWESEGRLRRTWRTPVGDLTELVHYDDWGLSSYSAEYKLKGPQDLPVLEWMLGDEEWEWDQAAYDRDVQRVGRRGCAQFYFRRSPIQGLFIEHMGFEKAI